MEEIDNKELYEFIFASDFLKMLRKAALEKK
jgi:hypothetical protein